VKVLFVCPFFPYPPRSGGKIRTFNLIRSAGKQVEIHLRAVRDPDYQPLAEPTLGAHCASIKTFERSRPGPVMRWSRPKLERWFHSPALRAALEEDLRDGDFDLVHLDELLLARILPPAPPIPVVQHHHKLDTVLYDRLSSDKGVHRHFDLWKLRRLESVAARRYRHHIVCGAQDAEILAHRYPGLEFGVVPSGFDPDYFHRGPHAMHRRERRVLFLGTLSYGPNVDALERFVSSVLPRLRERFDDVHLDVVGGDPTPGVMRLHGNGVNIIGQVPDVRPYVEGASLLVVPLRIGGGTRLKIVEALAMVCPIVSTTVGAEGLGLVHREHLLLADTPDDLFACVAELLEHPQQAVAMAERGRAYVYEHFRWDALAERLVACWRDVVEKEAARTAARSE